MPQPLHSWRESLLVYSRPRVIGMLFLGFSAGLPFLLVFSTLSAWLTEAGISRSAIGLFSWIGITYSIKVFWAPVVDRLQLPVLTRMLGRRRSWMLVAQMGIALGLFGMAMTDPLHTLPLALFALLVAFSSATQDIAIDAYRIEAVEKEYQGAMAATYILGYRLALLVAGAGAFYISDATSWPYAYTVMALLMTVGMAAVLIIREPERRAEASTGSREANLIERLEHGKSLNAWQHRLVKGFGSTVVAPFVDFFSRNGRMALFILLFIATFRLTDITMGIMANPFYLDLGFSKTDIANVTKVFGFFMTIFGTAVGGLIVMRYGLLYPLLLAAIFAAATNLLFSYMSTVGPDLSLLAFVVSADNLSGGFANAVFIAYLSSLTNTAYTATQYALFSSLMTLPAKFMGGFSGFMVDGYGYQTFFTTTAVLGLPAILLCLYLIQQNGRKAYG
ncbi:MAG: AmpG family muropeptide MFS transporter [Gammaproteobacteria bacterium]|nr:AmpG family muropeptide MFS transporter [Gammaproteobacteria bacterium]